MIERIFLTIIQSYYRNITENVQKFWHK